MAIVDEESHLNLQELVEKYVWSGYKQETSHPRRFLLRKRNFRFNVEWSQLEFKHEAVAMDNREDSERLRVNQGQVLDSRGSNPDIKFTTATTVNLLPPGRSLPATVR